MTKREIIELYLADLNNLVPDSDAKRSRIIDLEDEMEALRIHGVQRSEQLVSFVEWLEKQSEHSIDRGWIDEYIQVTNCA